MSMIAAIRPRAQHLGQLPTLAVETPDSPTVSEEVRAEAKRYGVSYVLELKLETPHARYWLCTKGLPAPETASDELRVRRNVHFPENWIEGYVTMDLKEPNEDGVHESISYGPHMTGQFQGFDYLIKLALELARLKDDCGEEPTHDQEKQLDAIRGEIHQVEKQLGWVGLILK